MEQLGTILDVTIEEKGHYIIKTISHHQIYGEHQGIAMDLRGGCLYLKLATSRTRSMTLGLQQAEYKEQEYEGLKIIIDEVVGIEKITSNYKFGNAW